MSVNYKRAIRLPVYTGTSQAMTPEHVNSAPEDACAGDEVFAQALHDDSNQELDWLWVYVQARTDTQRRYCLQRALAINPKCEIALRELAQLRAGA